MPCKGQRQRLSGAGGVKCRNSVQKRRINKLEEIQTSLPAETLEDLRQEATQLIAQEYGKVQFGEQTLIRLKMEELIRERYV